ncbi:MAG: tRNA (adenosine(37)-N6)-threonylcarbamoyltransferase complex transferase subunit TsaD [Deltaproteobacteria bacterium]|nr:tRNA (adenosine(37)-N6)-threonylcarbamoyltransferase complex transferase subunit TsaD [Candidatus Anaeroferrophillacea bacterium]
MMILAVETSCDDTCAAVLEAPDMVRANVISSQVEVHAPFGGVVPELASRHHLENMPLVVNRALAEAGARLDDIELVCVTRGPGLVGSLLVGLSFAKAVAFARRLPLVGVHHVEGHLLSPLLENPHISFPYVGLVASGGHTSLFLAADWHTYRLLGRTIDDAAGEAFDKVAKMLELGYPGGPLIERLAGDGDPAAVRFPRAWLAPDSFDFSFSGLKTAVRTVIERGGHRPADIAASFQAAVADVLTARAVRAAERHGVSTVVMAGGVACNRTIRDLLRERAAARGFAAHCASPVLCTDNGAMIGLVGYRRFCRGLVDDRRLNASSRLAL